MFEKIKFYLLKRNIDKFIKKCGVPIEAVDFLDIGCGRDANMLQMFTGTCRSLTGIDFYVDETRLKKSNIQWYTGNVENILPRLPAKSYNMITILSVLEHVDNPRDILLELRRIIKPSGIIFINSPSWTGKWVLENIVIPYFDKTGSYKIQVNTHKRYFTQSSLWQLLSNSGYKSSEINIWYSNLFCSVSCMICNE